MLFKREKRERKYHISYHYITDDSDLSVASVVLTRKDKIRDKGVKNIVEDLKRTFHLKEVVILNIQKLPI